MVAALTPVLFIGFVRIMFVRSVRSIDELEPRLQLEALALPLLPYWLGLVIAQRRDT